MLVAVYGTLRKGNGNHRLLKRSKYIDTYRLKGWDMYDMGCPYVDRGEGEITVEVYEVDETTMGYLDGLEGYPMLYDRCEVETPAGTAWMYFIKADGFSPRIKSGDYNENLGNFRYTYIT